MFESNRKRLVAVIVVTLVILGIPTWLYIVGVGRANNEIARIENKASTAVIDRGELAQNSYNNSTTDPISSLLGVPSLDVSLKQRGNDWCIIVHVKRLLATRRALFHLVSPSNRLVRVESCT